MVDVTQFYNFLPVANAQSVLLFHRNADDTRDLAEDFPIQIEELPRLISFLLAVKEDNPDATVDDFLTDGFYNKALQEEIKKCNQAGYAVMQSSGKLPDIQNGYIQMVLFRGFVKPKAEIDALLRRNDEERARRNALAEASPNAGPVLPRTVVVKKGEIRKRTPPQKNLFPSLKFKGAIRNRSPSPAKARLSPATGPAPFDFSPQRRSASPPAPFGGGETQSNISLGQESSLTRLLNRIGTYESMSDLWTLDTDNLRSLFPQALRMREPEVLVAEMEFQGGAVEPDVQIEDK